MKESKKKYGNYNQNLVFAQSRRTRIRSVLLIIILRNVEKYSKGTLK